VRAGSANRATGSERKIKNISRENPNKRHGFYRALRIWRSRRAPPPPIRRPTMRASKTLFPLCFSTSRRQFRPAPNRREPPPPPDNPTTKTAKRTQSQSGQAHRPKSPKKSHNVPLQKKRVCGTRAARAKPTQNEPAQRTSAPHGTPSHAPVQNKLQTGQPATSRDRAGANPSQDEPTFPR
jgi:hypothetical protein